MVGEQRVRSGEVNCWLCWGGFKGSWFRLFSMDSVWRKYGERPECTDKGVMQSEEGSM